MSSSIPHPTVTDRLALWTATLGPVGRFPVAPGTAGSAAAALTAPWLFLPLGPAGRLLVLCLVFVIGALAASRAEHLLDRKDPGPVVVDELLGQWIALWPLSTADPWAIVLAFVLFRILDMTKPPPIRQSEGWLPGGYGIMLDDALAGAVAALVLWVIW